MIPSPLSTATGLLSLFLLSTSGSPTSPPLDHFPVWKPTTPSGPQIPLVRPHTEQQPSSSGWRDADRNEDMESGEVVRVSWVENEGDLVGKAWRRALADMDVDIWRSNSTSTDVLLSPRHADLRSSHPSLKFHTLIPSLLTLLTRPAPTPPTIHPLTAPHLNPIHETYHTLDQLYYIMRSFAVAFPAAELVTIGKSALGVDIMGIRVSSPEVELRERAKKKGRKQDEKPKLGFVVVGGLHAREWIAPATVLYLAHSFLLESASPSPPTRLLSAFTFTFIPTLNPDGYTHTFTDRLWRKSRQTFEGTSCVGVDLNRNFGSHFTPPSSRTTPCSDTYPGPSPLSTPETASLTTYILSPQNNVRAFLDLHSYGQQVVFPYSWSCGERVGNEEDLWEAGFGVVKAVRGVEGREYELGRRCDVTYPSGGNSIDWSYAVGKVPYTFASELRDFGTFGFLLPPTQIRAQGEEVKAMVESLAGFVRRKEKRF